MAPKNPNLFQRLTGLFRAGPVVSEEKSRDYSGPSVSSALEIFRRQYSDVYNSTLSAYGSFDRMSRYSDFSEMEATPEIASALDIYAEETVFSPTTKGKSLHIYSENRRIEELLRYSCFMIHLTWNLIL